MAKEEFSKIVDLPDFVKNNRTGAIINTNLSALEAYRTQRQQFTKINNSIDRLGELENKVDAILNMLTDIAGKNK